MVFGYVMQYSQIQHKQKWYGVDASVIGVGNVKALCYHGEGFLYLSYIFAYNVIIQSVAVSIENDLGGA